jgi:hypothetical protein
MYGVRLVRTHGAFQEEYGRILFDGKQVQYRGLTCIFRKYLERGITGPDRKVYRPNDGISFLNSLKFRFADGTLKVAEIDRLDQD